MKQFYYFILGALALYLLACFSVYISQESLIFPARTAPEYEYNKITQEHPNSVYSFTTKDGVILSGWFQEIDPDQPLYIYYSGNAEDVTYTYLSLIKTTKRSILAVNYRGYGRSQGSPTQNNLFNDALEIFDSVNKKYPNRKIGLIGRSLGSGVACFVASQRDIHSLILITPYDSIKAIAKKQYPLLPVSLILNHPFESEFYAKKISAPTMILTAEFDFVIPAKNSQNLFDHLNNKKEIHCIPGTTHNSMINDPSTQSYMFQFIERSKI